MAAPALRIPIIDLTGTFSSDARDRVTIARRVGAASREIGMFYVTEHGISASLIAAQFALARAFFELDADEKRAIEVSRSSCFRGYEAFGTQTIDAAAPGDLKEGFIMGPELTPDHPHVLAGYPNTGANLWPRRPAGFRRQMEAYVAAINGLGRRLAALLALSLDVPEGYFSSALAEPLTYSQMLCYPPVPSDTGSKRLGAGAHVDWGLFTILLQDDVGGLEILTPDTGWQPAPPIRGSFVIILGEMVLRLTDGRYRSAKHRVVKNTSGHSRYSMPTFFDPDYDYRVACVPTCVAPGHAPRYPACSVAEHMRQMARGTLSVHAHPMSARHTDGRSSSDHQ
jgi:isopenicillin N synthase-like dioxygenase